MEPNKLVLELEKLDDLIIVYRQKIKDFEFAIQQSQNRIHAIIKELQGSKAGRDNCYYKIDETHILYINYSGTYSIAELS